jgi:tetratricopeptide (TPR) repeat protein
MGLGNTPAAMDALKAAIAIERKLGKGFWLAFSLGMLASRALTTGDISNARQAAEEAFSLREGYDRRWQLVSLPILMAIEHRLGNHARAAALHQEIRQNLEHVDHPMFMPTFLALGLDARFQGQPEEAQAYFREGLKIAQRIKSRVFIAINQSELAHIARERGDLMQARDAYRKLIYTWKELGQMGATANLLECFAFIARNEGEAERAVRLMGAAEAIREDNQLPMTDAERVEYEASLLALRGQVDPAAFASAWAAGRAMGLESAISYAVTPDGTTKP